MKNSSLSSCIKMFCTYAVTMIIAYNSVAQSVNDSLHNKFRIDFVLGGAFDVKGSNKYTQEYGAVVGFEPRINLHNGLAVGLRYFYSEVFNSPDSFQTRKNMHTVLVNFTYAKTITYSFHRQHSVPLNFGIGAGMNHIKTAETISSKSYANKSKVAVMPRIGFEAGRFLFNCFYNYTGLSETNFFGAEIGFYLGGDRKNKD